MKKSRSVDYGDFSEKEVMELLVKFTDSIKRGSTGWGISFKDWLWLHNIAKHQGFFKLKRL